MNTAVLHQRFDDYENYSKYLEGVYICLTFDRIILFVVVSNGGASDIGSRRTFARPTV
jgi:hypothetical protein